MESSRLTGVPVNSGSRENLGEISIASLLNQGEKGGCGYNKAPNEGRLVSVVKQRKTLEGHCWLCYSLFRLSGRKLPHSPRQNKAALERLSFQQLGAVKLLLLLTSAARQLSLPTLSFQRELY
jgi:hypothetical protein